MTDSKSFRALQRAANARTALVLAGVALAFFGGIIVAQCFGPSPMWLGSYGVALAGLVLAVMAGRRRAR